MKLCRLCREHFYHLSCIICACVFLENIQRYSVKVNNYKSMESQWLSSCSTMLKDKCRLRGAAWAQFIMDTLNIVDGVVASDFAIDVKSSVGYISALVVAHCDEEDSHYPATFLLSEKICDLLVQLFSHENIQVRELCCHCLTLLLNPHSIPKCSKQCCTEAVEELFEACCQILSQKPSDSSSNSFVEIIKPSEKSGVRSGQMLSQLEDVILKGSQLDQNNQAWNMKRLITTCLYGHSIQHSFVKAISSLPLLSKFQTLQKDKCGVFVKEEWDFIILELKFMNSLVNSPSVGRKGYVTWPLLDFLVGISSEECHTIASRFLSVIDICLLLSKTPLTETPQFCFTTHQSYLQIFSSWLYFFCRAIPVLPDILAGDLLFNCVVKVTNFFETFLTTAPESHPSNVLFYTLLLDLGKLLNISMEFLSAKDANEKVPGYKKHVSDVTKGASVLFSILQYLLRDPTIVFIDEVSVKEGDTDHEAGQYTQDNYMSDFDACYIDEDSSIDRMTSKKPAKSPSQDDPCTALFNLFAMDDNLTVPMDVKSQCKTASIGLTGLLNVIRATPSNTPPSDFWQWTTKEGQPRVSLTFMRHLILTIGANFANLLRKMNKAILEVFGATWNINEFCVITVSLRKFYPRPISRHRASLLNVIKYIVVSLVQRNLINPDNCMQIFASNAVGSSDFWLANVDAFVRRLVFVFAFHLSSVESSAMLSFVQELWNGYLATISKLNLENFNKNAAVLSISLANDMLFYFYLLPFTEKRSVISRICNTLTQLVAASTPFDYNQFSILLAFSDLLLCRFVYELPESSLKERLVCGPVDDASNAVLMTSYDSDSHYRTAFYETLCQEHQIKPPPSLDRLGLASFCAFGVSSYNNFYSALLQLSDPDRFGGGVGVDSVALKISSVWNTWLGLWYLLPVLPPTQTEIEQLIAVDVLKSPSCSSLTPHVLLFSSITTLLLQENTGYNAWMEDAFNKLTKNSSENTWANVSSVFTLDNLLMISAAYLKKIAFELKQTYLPFAIDSKIPDSLPSLAQLLAVQLLICNISRLLVPTKDFDESAVEEMVKNPNFTSFIVASLELLEWMLYVVKFAASHALNCDEVNDKCLHLRAFLEEYSNSDQPTQSPVPSPSPKPPVNVFDQLISKAAVRTVVKAGSRSVYSPLQRSIDLKPFILNPYFRHLYCCIEMFLELYKTTAAQNSWKTSALSLDCSLTVDVLNAGTEPTFTSAVFEVSPYLQTGPPCNFSPLSELLTDVFGDVWTIANGEYLLALSHRLVYAIAETPGVGVAVNTSKSVSLKQAALKCISGLLPTSKEKAVIWQRTYSHSIGESCDLGKLLICCSEPTLQPLAVDIVCQLLVGSMKNGFEQELTGVVATLNSLANENSIMFLLMSLLSSAQGSRSILEELLGSFVAASSVIGSKLFLSMLDCLLKVCGEALASSEFNAVSEHIFPAIVLTTRALPNGEGHVQTLSLMTKFLRLSRKAIKDSDGKEDGPIATAATFLAYTCRVLASASNAFPSAVPRPNFDSAATEELLRALFSPLGGSSQQDGKQSSTTSGDTLQSNDGGDVEDGDEDEEIDSKLCTFTQSQKSFMNQHWYHCHTCSMTDGFGVCSVCAKVCHKDHDLAYAKFSSFFCDCGAKEDNSCSAKTRRISGSSRQQQQQPTSGNAQPSSSSSQQPSIAARFGRLGVLARGRPLPPTPPISQAVDLRRQPSSSSSQQPPQQSQAQSQGRLTTTQSTPVLSSPLFTDSFTITEESAVQRFVSVIKENRLSNEVSAIMLTLCEFLKSTDETTIPSTRLSERCRTELERLSSSPLSIQIGASLFIEQGHIDLTADFKFDSHKVFENDKTRLKQLVETGKIRLRLVACNPKGQLGYYAVIQARNRLDFFGLNHLALAASSSSNGQKNGASSQMSKPRKYQPHKLGCVTLPFSLAGVEINIENDALVVAYGSSDVEVMVLSPSSFVPREQMAVQVQLESQQSYIVGCRWLTGSPSVLGVIVNDCVKIFDTAVDLTTPMYHFLLPSGKIADMTFAVYSKDEQYALILGANGHVYVQRLSVELCGAFGGPFYVTSVVVARGEHKSLPSAWKNAAKTLGDGGLSICYSHRLRLLTITCESGVYLLPGFLPDMKAPSDMFVDNIICVSPRNNREKWLLNNCDYIDQLVPGLIFGFSDTGSAIVLSVRPDCVSIAISDQLNHCGVRCCHYFLAPLKPSSRKLCLFGIDSDGKLLKFLLNEAQVTHWMAYSSPLIPEMGSILDFSGNETEPSAESKPPDVKPSTSLEASSTVPAVKRVSASAEQPSTSKRPSLGSSSRGSYAAAASAAVVRFPVDFFEHCQPASNVEFGGSQLLYVYNREQLKTRLAPTNSSQYIAASGAFTLSITNKTIGTVLAGIRLQFGNHRNDRVPQFIRIFERTIPISLSQPRWYDCALSRSEAIAARNKLLVYFGPSSSSTTIVDSVHVFVKSREEFGWVEPDIDVPTSTSMLPLMGANAASVGKNADIHSSRIYPPIYVTSSTQMVLLSCIAILRRLEASLSDEKMIVQLLQTPTTLTVLRSTLSWLLSNVSPTTVRALVQIALEGIKNKRDIPHCELALLLHSFLALTSKNVEEETIRSPNVLRQLVDRYHGLGTDRPYTWSTTSICQLELTRILTLVPYLVLLLLEAIGRPQSANMLTSLLANPNIDESFVVQQALDMFYFSSSSSPWATLMAGVSTSAYSESSPVTLLSEKCHSE